MCRDEIVDYIKQLEAQPGMAFAITDIKGAGDPSISVALGVIATEARFPFRVTLDCVVNALIVEHMIERGNAHAH